LPFASPQDIPHGFPESQECIVRLDLFLKVSRLVKTRSRSHELCTLQKVTINNRQAKPGKSVKPHDIITIDFGKRLLVIEVMSIPEGNVKKDQSSLLYTLIKDEKVDVRL
jgi:ribosomal 50S subunit-recycling heat shock protein